MSDRKHVSQNHFESNFLVNLPDDVLKRSFLFQLSDFTTFYSKPVLLAKCDKDMINLHQGMKTAINLKLLKTQVSAAI